MLCSSKLHFFLSSFVFRFFYKLFYNLKESSSVQWRQEREIRVDLHEDIADLSHQDLEGFRYSHAFSHTLNLVHSIIQARGTTNFHPIWFYVHSFIPTQFYSRSCDEHEENWGIHSFTHSLIHSFILTKENELVKTLKYKGFHGLTSNIYNLQRLINFKGCALCMLRELSYYYIFKN